MWLGDYLVVAECFSRTVYGSYVAADDFGVKAL